MALHHSIPVRDGSICGKEHWYSFGDSCLAISEFAPEEGQDLAPGHALFFLHGRFGQGEIWKPLMRKLASHFHCFAVDLPGFGRSFTVRGRGFSMMEQAYMIRHVIERFAAAGKRAVLIGHDIGGTIAQLCAIHEPDVLSGLVLINSTALTQAASGFKTGFLCAKVRGSLRRMLKDSHPNLSAEHRQLLARAWENRSRRAPMAQAFQTWKYTWPGPFERQTWREQIRKLKHPVLLLWGGLDEVNPKDSAEELMRYLPDAYLFEHDQLGHWPCLENTDWVDSKMREFLFRVAADRYCRVNSQGGRGA